MKLALSAHWRAAMMIAAAINFCALNNVAGAADTSSAAKSQGPWVIVPATRSPVVFSGTNYLIVWRLNTLTGELDACTYDPGGWKSPAFPGGVAPPRLDCTDLNRPSK